MVTTSFALPTYSVIYAFGGSQSDAGNSSLRTGLRPASPPYFSQTYDVAGMGPVTASVFSNGPTWVQDLSISLGLGVLAPSLLGGTDFARGGAVTGPTPQNPGSLGNSLPQQIADFRVAIPNPEATALYTISIGINDVIDLIGNPLLSQTDIQSGITAAVNNELASINQLIAGGANHLLVVNVADLGLIPSVTEGLVSGSNTPSAAFNAEATAASALYNSLLADGIATIAARGIDIKIEDTFQLLDNAAANPAAFGLIDTTTPVWSGLIGDPTSGTLISSDPLVQNQYLFFDHMHLTATGQLALASGALSILAGGVQCFAAGTRIDTPHGPVAVENLGVGDLVCLHKGGSASVLWLGHRTVDCERHPRPWDVCPVKVCAGAFGRGRPRKDIFLSPDHAIYANGALIPVRYLINGATIAQQEAGSITYWHIELPSHAVILAEGLPCESYLDTGNRASFNNGGNVIALFPSFDDPIRTWSEHGCAPLVRDGAALTQVRAELLSHASQLGFTAVNTPELCLVTDQFHLLPTFSNGGMHRFTLPAGTKAVSIRSTSGVPADHAPESQDRRRLGVMITAMVLRRAGERHDLPLNGPWRGFHPIEREGTTTWRWTDGDGEVALPANVTDQPCLLDIHIAAVQPRWQRPPSPKRVATESRPGQLSAHA